MNTNKISAVVCTYNSEKYLERCLNSVNFVEELIIFDDGSTDGTLKIAEKFTEKIFHHKSVGYVEPVRNLAISKAKNNWILIVDADEEIPSTLSSLLKTLVDQNQDVSAYFIPRKNIIFGKWIKTAGWWPDYQLRLFKKGRIEWLNKIHSSPAIQGTRQNIEIKEEHAIVHHNYQNISQFLIRMDKYTSVEARELIEIGYSINWIHVITKPLDEFNSRFFAREGYRDGLHGFALSIMQSFSVFIIYMKVWESLGFKQVNEKEFVVKFQNLIDDSISSMKHWIYEVFIKTSRNPVKKVIFKIKRKIN